MTVDSDIAELTASIKKGLDAKGALSSIRAQLRAQVFGAMAISMPQPEQKPTLNPAAKVALALIEEFLRFHECSCTLSTAESEVSGWSERLPGGELASSSELTSVSGRSLASSPKGSSSSRATSLSETKTSCEGT